MNIKIKVVCRKDRVNQENKAPLFIRFIQLKKVKYVATGLTVHVDDWDFEKQQFKETTEQFKEIQYQIDTLVNTHHKKIKRLEALDIEVNFDTLFETSRKRISYTLEDCFKATIKRLESLGKYGSASKHKTALSALKQAKKATTKLDEMDLVFLNDFELFLRQKGNQDNSIATKFSLIKALYNKALHEELFTPKSNPFSKFKVGRLWTETRKRAITKDEIQQIIDLEVPTSSNTHYLQFAKDIFLFTYYSAGINFRDIATLKHHNITNGRLNYVRHKTGKKISCKLLPKAQNIMEKYSSPFYDENDYLFPILNANVHKTELQQFNRIHKALAKVNKQLKKIGTLAGIATPLTTYTARHSYATVLKRSGVNIALISESLGHSELSTTQIYLDSFENEQIDEAMQNLL